MVPNAVANFECSLERNTMYDKRNLSFLPKAMSELAAAANSQENFLDNFPSYSKKDLELIEKGTRGQSTNKQWFEQRNGRITASNFRDVHPKVNSIKAAEKPSDVDATKLVAKLVGYTKLNPNLPALKHGRTAEPNAIHKYRSVLKTKGHTQVKISQCGLFIDTQKIYLGASPDSVVRCCCGEGILEVKCPLSRNPTVPSSDNVSYLILKDGEQVLKRSHKYYDQVQGQLAITGKAWCDFFVYTRHGYVMQRIYPDKKYWASLASNLEFFYHHYVAPELVTRELLSSISFIDESPLRIDSESPPCMSNPKDMPNGRRKRKGEGSVLGRPSKRKSKPIYICGKCSFICKQPGTELIESSRTCRKCHQWYHISCIDKNDSKKTSWMCEKCCNHL